MQRAGISGELCTSSMWTERRHSAAECNVRPAGSNELLTKTSRLDNLLQKNRRVFDKKSFKEKGKRSFGACNDRQLWGGPHHFLLCNTYSAALSDVKYNL